MAPTPEFACGKDIPPGHPHKFAVHDGTLRSEVATPLLKGFSQEWPPMPTVPEDLKKDSEYVK